MAWLSLTNSIVRARIDDDDLERCLKHRWRVKKSAYNEYICTHTVINGKQTTLYLHRFIMQVQETKIQVHHKDSNIYDNRKRSLLVLTDTDHSNISNNKRWSKINSLPEKPKDNIPF